MEPMGAIRFAGSTCWTAETLCLEPRMVAWSPRMHQIFTARDASYRELSLTRTAMRHLGELSSCWTRTNRQDCNHSSAATPPAASSASSATLSPSHPVTAPASPRAAMYWQVCDHGSSSSSKSLLQVHLPVVTHVIRGASPTTGLPFVLHCSHHGTIKAPGPMVAQQIQWEHRTVARVCIFHPLRVTWKLERHRSNKLPKPWNCTQRGPIRWCTTRG